MLYLRKMRFLFESYDNDNKFRNIIHKSPRMHGVNKLTLNTEQLAATQHIDGPMIIIAGPGSGKTKVITERITNLMLQGIRPQNILALTFTNKAAKEMTTRITEIQKNNHALSIWMGTFHSIFAKILRQECSNIDYSTNFTIYDNDDSLKIIRRIIQDLNLEKETYNAKSIFSRISLLKNHLITHEKYTNHQELINLDTKRKQPLFKKIYAHYCQECQQSNALDFDDLLIKTYQLFNNNKEILEKYQDIFQYVLIDEYQDTNKVQDAIIKQIARKNQNVCVVGDDSQSIYSFRGANINNMLNFKNNYNNVKEFKLEQNYRSTKNIVNAANSLIAHNKNKIEKTIFTHNEDGDKIKLLEYQHGREEGEQIASIIHHSIIKNKKKSNHAILYRTNSQSKAFEDGLRRLGINYKIFGGLSFYQRKEIKDVIAFLKLIINNNDDQSLLRIINYPTRGIGASTINKIRIIAVENRTTIWNTINSSLIEKCELNTAAKKNVTVFTIMLNEFLKLKNINIFQIIKHVVEKTGIVRRLQDDPTEDNINRIKNISELFNSIQRFSLKKNKNTLTDFINEISLDEINENTKADQDYVSLMTLHQAKGLEFPYVYIVGLENGLFPSEKNLREAQLLEEERRLLYVGITRGIKKVTLSYALNRFRFGMIDTTEKSLFIEEINYFFIDNVKKHRGRQVKSKYAPPKINNKKLIKITKQTSQGPQRTDLKIGQIIKHNIFGKGEIKDINNQNGNQTIKVFFKENGEKILLTKFAKIKIIA